ncbi:hypothetical protein AB3S75_029800 [Citrus x aurantiifolia]
MELIPNCNSLKRCWRRRGYQKLNDARKRNVRVIRLKGPSSSRCWRIKAVPKLCFKIIASPLRLWTKFKNGYIRKMNNLAGKVGSLNNDNVFGGRRIPRARQGDKVIYSNEEIENRLVLEIYKILVATGRDISSLQMDCRNH